MRLQGLHISNFSVVYDTLDIVLGVTQVKEPYELCALLPSCGCDKAGRASCHCSRQAPRAVVIDFDDMIGNQSPAQRSTASAGETVTSLHRRCPCPMIARQIVPRVAPARRFWRLDARGQCVNAPGERAKCHVVSNLSTAS
jgi:hypothetical protein